MGWLEVESLCGQSSLQSPFCGLFCELTELGSRLNVENIPIYHCVPSVSRNLPLNNTTRIHTSCKHLLNLLLSTIQFQFIPLHIKLGKMIRTHLPRSPERAREREQAQAHTPQPFLIDSTQLTTKPP